jgi:hypothetical protein
MTDEAMSPLRRRMIEDMTIRKFVQKTQHDYVRRVKNFARSRHGESRTGQHRSAPSQHGPDLGECQRQP